MPNPPTASTTLTPVILHCDDDLVVLDKPTGLLSVPGKTVLWSVQTWLAQQVTGPATALLAHRLDMSTSGLLLATLNAKAHKRLQHQFIKRSMQKRYIGILDKPLAKDHYQVDLPLRVDLDNRPRQMVCYQHGKPASTRVEVTERDARRCRVVFHPVTGRTHQLRVHAAHPRGLHAPIVGDELYGTEDTRLMLHAEWLRFRHPGSGEFIEFSSPAPF